MDDVYVVFDPDDIEILSVERKGMLESSKGFPINGGELSYDAFVKKTDGMDILYHGGMMESIERVGGKRLSEYPRYSISSKVVIYRAQASDSDMLLTDSYITLSPKFAIEHAENNHVYNDEQQIVIRAVVNPKDVADASNPGEYFYKGQPIKGIIAYRTKGDDYEGDIPDIRNTVL